MGLAQRGGAWANAWRRPGGWATRDHQATTKWGMSGCPTKAASTDRLSRQGESTGVWTVALVGALFMKIQEIVQELTKYDENSRNCTKIHEYSRNRKKLYDIVRILGNYCEFSYNFVNICEFSYNFVSFRHIS